MRDNDYGPGYVRELAIFYAAIKDDPRIGTTHISMYISLLHLYILNGFSNPVAIKRASLMELAKISGIVTYHKCIRDLKESGYIEYTPSYNSIVSSRIVLLRI